MRLPRCLPGASRWQRNPEPRCKIPGHRVGILSLVVSVIAYALVISEESIQLRRSKPVMVAAGLVWMLASFACQQADLSDLSFFKITIVRPVQGVGRNIDNLGGDAQFLHFLGIPAPVGSNHLEHHQRNFLFLRHAEQL